MGASSSRNADCMDTTREALQPKNSVAEGGSDQAPAQCRMCWCEGDEDDGGCLVAPCSCSGTQKWVHERCLREWRRTQMQQSLYQRSRMCEVCKSPYRSPEYLQPISDKERLQRRLLGLLRRLRAQALDVRGWAWLAMKIWRAYVFGSGLFEAGRMGFKGLRAGAQLGRALVKEQTEVLTQMLNKLARLLGSPYAELLWTQAAAAAVVGLASEFLYTSAVGLATGAVYGFIIGYTTAINASVVLLKRGCAGSVSLLLRAVGRATSGLSSHAAKVPAAMPGLRRLLCRMGRGG